MAIRFSVVGRKDLILRNPFVRNITLLAGGTAIGRALGALASPIISRLYAPEDVGRAGMFVAFVSFASTATSLKYEAAIVSAGTKEEAAYLAALSLALVLPMSGLACGLLYWLASRSLLGFGELPSLSVLLAFPALVCSAAFLVLRYWLIRNDGFGIVSRVLVLQQGTRAASQIALGPFGAGWLGLVVGEVVGRASGLGRMIVSVGRPIRAAVQPWQAARLWRVALTHRKFAIFSLPSSLVDNLATAIVLPLLGMLYGAVTAGQFALVQLVFAVPLAFVGASVADAFFHQVSGHVEDPRRARRLLLKTAGALFLAAILPTAVVAVWGRPLFSWVFGGAWVEAGRMAAAMAPLALAQLVVGPLTPVVYVFRGQELKLLYDSGRLVAVGILLVAHGHGLSAVAAVRVWAWLECFLYALYLVILLRIIRVRDGEE